MKRLDTESLLSIGRATVDIEAEAVLELKSRIDQAFVEACERILACTGRVVVTGMGKSGHIGSKIAATLASTGTPAFFVHPGEASHGDLGMITRQDLVIAISNSGETSEVLTILPLIKRLGVPLISMTGKPASTLAQAATVHLDVSVAKEACPLNLAPTASTTATLVMGDALAVGLLESRGFTKEDFALSHPGGSLGRRLLLTVAELMRSGDELPVVESGTPLRQALLEMTRKGLGMTAIVDATGVVIGVYTDGDLRRTLDSGVDLRTVPIDEVMTRGGRSIEASALAAAAVERMEAHKITALLVKGSAGELLGIVHMHDMLRAGVV